MNKFCLTLATMAMAASASAQLPRWVIEPACDTLFVKIDRTMLQSEAGSVSTLWTMEGKKLFSTENTIMPFSDGVATILTPDNRIAGVIDYTGRHIALPNLPVAYGNPYFSDGHLISFVDGKYVYYDKEGKKADYKQPAEIAYPFRHGYAPFLTFDNMEKHKDPHYGYYRADRQDVTFRMAGKNEVRDVEPRNIAFLSVITTEGKGIGVVKDKLYWFDTATGIFEPMVYGDDKNEKKRHLTLSGDYEHYFITLPSDTVMIQARYGKDNIAVLTFDGRLNRLYIRYHDGEKRFGAPTVQPVSYASDLAPTGSAPFGVSFASKPVLPHQFQDTGLAYGNRMFVKTDGKWGVIEILPGRDITLRLNKGEDVAFRHQKFETQLRLDLPAEISAARARVEIPESTGCDIDKTSRESKDTESGNFVTYNCVLNIPKDLPDTITTLSYRPVEVSYDGITLFDRPIDVRAWHLKYYNVDPIESETTIDNGVASFTININAQRMAGESDYPFDVRIEADSVDVRYEKLSETRYKCMVSNLLEGNNNLNILVTEKGCPASVFPFEVFYTKPVPKKKKKEEVVVRKKSPARIEL